MKNSVIISIITIVIVCNFILLLRNEKLKNEISLFYKEVKLLQQYNFSYKSNFQNSIINNCIKLDKDVEVYDSNGTCFNLDEICETGYKLFIYYSVSNCISCIDKDMMLIKQLVKNIGNNNIFIITNHSNSRELKIFKKSNSIDYNIFFCDNLGLPYEQEVKTFIFICDPTLLVRHFFIPDVDLPQISNEFFSAIYQRYFSLNINL